METLCLDSIQLNTRLIFQSLYIDQKKKWICSHVCHAEVPRAPFLSHYFITAQTASPSDATSAN